MAVSHYEVSCYRNGNLILWVKTKDKLTWARSCSWSPDPEWFPVEFGSNSTWDLSKPLEMMMWCLSDDVAQHCWRESCHWDEINVAYVMMSWWTLWGEHAVCHGRDRNKHSLHVASVGEGNSYMGCIALGTRYLNLLTWPMISDCFILILTSSE